MARYRHTSDHAQLFPTLGLELEPGQEFETDQDVNHPDLAPVEGKEK